MSSRIPFARCLVLLLAFLLVWLTTQRYHTRNDSNTYHVDVATLCRRQLGADWVTALMFADPGDFSGSAEAKHILSNLKNKRQVSTETTVCGNRYVGTLMGQDVTVITTGIGDTAAALCAYEVLLTCGGHIRDIIYFGTSGWSPAKGGMLDATACQKANQQPDVARLGDVCISPFSIDWACKKASWEQQCSGYPNACFLPKEASGPEAAYLHGQCVFTSVHRHSLQLADELLAAAAASDARSKAPRRIGTLQAHEQHYWSLMAAGTQGSMPQLPPDAAPRLWSYRQCSEVDGRFFYSGLPYEMLSREYVAHTINQGLNYSSAAETRSETSSTETSSTSPSGTSSTALRARGSLAGLAGSAGLSGGATFRAAAIAREPNVTRADVIAVAAMEGVGLAEAVLKYNHLASTSRAVPFTNVRAMSNWLHQPLAQVGAGNWSYGPTLPEDFQNGYSYAIATGSSYILALFRQRCLQQGRNHGECSYHVDYN